jgi:hypothetical protein
VAFRLGLLGFALNLRGRYFFDDSIMGFVGFDLEKKVVPVVICRYNRKLARVTIGSVQFIDATKSQKLWLRAWKKWSK